MNILLWVLQVLLAFHTAIGAFWKFSNSAAEAAPTLAAIPHGAWIALSIFELLCVVGLILPAFKKHFAKLAAIAAIGIAIEMLLFCGLHLASGDTGFGPVVYWLVVAALCGVIAYSRMTRK